MFKKIEDLAMQIFKHTIIVGDIYIACETGEFSSYYNDWDEVDIYQHCPGNELDGISLRIRVVTTNTTLSDDNFRGVFLSIPCYKVYNDCEGGLTRIIKEVRWNQPQPSSETALFTCTHQRHPIHNTSVATEPMIIAAINIMEQYIANMHEFELDEYHNYT